jgi:hypothetical protein
MLKTRRILQIVIFTNYYFKAFGIRQVDRIRKSEFHTSSYDVKNLYWEKKVAICVFIFSCLEFGNLVLKLALQTPSQIPSAICCHYYELTILSTLAG